MCIRDRTSDSQKVSSLAGWFLLDGYLHQIPALPDSEMQHEKQRLLEIRDKIAFITLNRPNQHNALCKSLLESLNDTLDKIKKDNRVKVAIIFANGKSFCSGHDLLEIKNTDNKEDFKQLFELCSKVMTKILSCLLYTSDAADE